MRMLWAGPLWLAVALAVLQLRGALAPRPPAGAPPRAVVEAFFRASVLGDCKRASEYASPSFQQRPRFGCPGGGSLDSFQIEDDGALVSLRSGTYHQLYVHLQVGGLEAFDRNLGFFVNVTELAPGVWRITSMGSGP